MGDKICPACKNESNSITNTCEKCKFPFEGSEKDKSIHIGRFISDKGIIADSEDYINKSQKFVGFAAAIYLLRAIIGFSTLLSSPIDFFINIFVITILIISAVFIKKLPFVFLLIPTLTLTTIYVIEYLVDFDIFINGIIFKLLIFGCLIYSIYINLESNKFKKKFNIK
ncbi:hypothetical protein VOI54_12860 [Tamlana sp. 2201CG12-4]|uniref:hypothetical protein n=1 Tax=Tamlana sp. 2201CG12-4 TaxID=3112582 RepID=UPI002DB9038F|nr:hypothetical protein [Tamlana sp. 2201CG12-4]MEC3907913.1 hypothetical protein [Tamlana sp. 2201CG12-4]